MNILVYNKLFIFQGIHFNFNFFYRYEKKMINFTIGGILNLFGGKENMVINFIFVHYFSYNILFIKVKNIK